MVKKESTKRKKYRQANVAVGKTTAAKQIAHRPFTEDVTKEIQSKLFEFQIERKKYLTDNKLGTKMIENVFFIIK